MIKAAFFDIDGTLVSFRDHKVPESAIEALKSLRARGVKTFLSTGRNGDSTRFLMETGLFDGEILINGQLCEYDGKCIAETPICKEDVETAIAGANSGEFTLGFLSGHQSFVNRVTKFVEKACSYANMAVPRLAAPEEAREYPIYQLHFYGAPGSEDALIQRTTALTATRWSPNFADVFPAGGGKDKGIEALINYLGIDRTETIAFGDGENDISMLEYAGIGVAMGNASDVVKSHANYVTTSVDDDGIARAVKELV